MKSTLMLLAYGITTLAAPALPVHSRRDDCKPLTEGEEVSTSCITNTDVSSAPFGSFCIVNGNKCTVEDGPTFTDICVTVDDFCALFGKSKEKKRKFTKLPAGVDSSDDCNDPEIAKEFPEECNGGFPGPNFGDRKGRRGFKKLPAGVDNGDDCNDPEIAKGFPEECQGGFPGPNFEG